MKPTPTDSTSTTFTPEQSSTFQTRTPPEQSSTFQTRTPPASTPPFDQSPSAAAPQHPTYCSADRHWFSLWTLNRRDHRVVIQLLAAALLEAQNLKVLPVVNQSEVDAATEFSDDYPLSWGSRATIGANAGCLITGPDDHEIELVSTTIRTIFAAQAIPPQCQPLVPELLRCIYNHIYEYSAVCEENPKDPMFPGRWDELSTACLTYGLSYDWQTYHSAVERVIALMNEFFEQDHATLAPSHSSAAAPQIPNDYL